MGEACSTDRVIYAIAQMSLSSKLNTYSLKLDEGAVVDLYAQRVDGVLKEVQCNIKFDRDNFVYGRYFDISKSNWREDVELTISSYLKAGNKHESIKH